MGAANVRLAFLRWAQLPDRPFRLLAHMALVSLDNASDGQQARRYFARRAEMIRALGRDPDTELELRAAQESVRAALATLVSAGAVTRLVRGGNGRTAVYRLNLDLLPEDLGQGEPGTTLQGEPGTQYQGEPVSSTRVSLAPRNHEEPLRNQDEDNHPSVLHLTSGDSATADDGFNAAHDALLRLSPERGQAALERAQREHPEASDHELVILAAEVAR